MMTDIQAMLMQQEGTGPRDPHGRFLPYPDNLGNLTIGYGHLMMKGFPADIVNMLLQVDIADAIEDVRHCCSCYDNLSRPRQLVMISMAFNLGRERLNGFVHFLGAIHRGDWEDAADEIMNSKAALQAPGRYKPLAVMMRMNTSAWI